MNRRMVCVASCAVALTAAVGATPVAAVTDCTNGITLGGGIFTPTDDYTTTSATTPCFIVQSSGLNMNGHTITCLNPNLCGTAIQAVDSSVSTVTVKNATILGPFTFGINTLGVAANLPVVTGNTIRGGTLLPIASRGKISGNVIYGDTNGCTYLSAIQFNTDNNLAAGSQYVTDNYIDCNDPNADGILVYSQYTGSGNGPKVENNFIRVPHIEILTNPFGNPGKSYFDKNILVSALCGTYEAGTFPGTGQATVTGNVCDRDLQDTDPQGIVCGSIIAPFTLP